FGIVVLEGWSANKPVVVTENGGAGELIMHEKNGLKIYPRPDSVTWGINRIFSNFDWSRQLGRNGRVFVEERYSWDKIADKTLEVYRQFCPEPVPQPVEIKQISEVSPKVQDTVFAVQSRNENVTVVLKAKIVIPPSSATNGEAYEILDALKTNLTSYGFVLQQKEHYLKIRGECEEVIKALYESWERLHQHHNEEGISLQVQAPSLEGAANGCG
ncbi:MAG: glycosyltransferase family 4 protein, partial [Sedimentisphaerales bacterium]